eukprot:CAMPEP_0204109288 /NCGR_PEP_ID=MMETSP0361-20130328/1205_1 /ASSEMBLY_ACC=CAM_ASM_000343 /TAXON_ID=268821 /ORGANISM="Scrippsiella Hangoei, Strain SHTV-5" /LENGTH=356 /DNA_ID=CAMNT_0051059029 /DNA_START=302 /DNA_END=1372 /DNA_ORIENTATION=+
MLESGVFCHVFLVLKAQVLWAVHHMIIDSELLASGLHDGCNLWQVEVVESRKQRVLQVVCQGRRARAFHTPQRRMPLDAPQRERRFCIMLAPILVDCCQIYLVIPHMLSKVDLCMGDEENTLEETAEGEETDTLHTSSRKQQVSPRNGTPYKEATTRACDINPKPLRNEVTRDEDDALHCTDCHGERRLHDRVARNLVRAVFLEPVEGEMSLVCSQSRQVEHRSDLAALILIKLGAHHVVYGLMLTRPTILGVLGLRHGVRLVEQLARILERARQHKHLHAGRPYSHQNSCATACEATLEELHVARRVRLAEEPEHDGRDRVAQQEELPERRSRACTQGPHQNAARKEQIDEEQNP